MNKLFCNASKGEKSRWRRFVTESKTKPMMIKNYTINTFTITYISKQILQKTIRRLSFAKSNLCF